MIVRIWEEKPNGELVYVRDGDLTVDDVRQSKTFLSAISEEDYHYDFVVGQTSYEVRLDSGKILVKWCYPSVNPFMVHRLRFETTAEFCNWLERIS